jgi:hypothetical protein
MVFLYGLYGFRQHNKRGFTINQYSDWIFIFYRYIIIITLKYAVNCGNQSDRSIIQLEIALWKVCMCEWTPAWSTFPVRAWERHMYVPLPEAHFL